MKKAIIIFLSVLIVLSLAACGGGNEELKNNVTDNMTSMKNDISDGMTTVKDEMRDDATDLSKDLSSAAQDLDDRLTSNGNVTGSDSSSIFDTTREKDTTVKDTTVKDTTARAETTDGVG